jgi:Zn-dependent protease
MQPQDDERFQDDRFRQPRQTAERKGMGRAAGGVLVGLALAAAKFKAFLALLFTFKWLLLAPKLLLSFGSIFLSIWFYALIFGWKLGVVFVLLILVHEMGHLVTFRNFGIPVSLPYFIPGLGAFVNSPLSGSPAQNATGALMGPVFGVAAAAVCWGYGATTGDPFWTVCAYLGFFLNLFNLIPALPLDGGRVVGVIDNRLYLIGAGLLLVFMLFYGHFSVFTVLILIMVLSSSVPRGLAAWRGQLDPHAGLASRGQRVAIGLAYVALLALALAGAAATHIDLPR